MPVVDMPLNQLKTYMGINPKPIDFDQFWDARLSEANQVELDYQLNETDLPPLKGCDSFELTFKGVDGSTRFAKYIRPTHQPSVPLIFQFHGYPGASRSYFEQLSHVGLGCAVLAMDCGGQGGKSEDLGCYKGSTVSGHIIMGLDDEPSNMYYVKLFQDIRILCRIALQLDGIDHHQLYANGASQGGALALVCAALNKEIKRCAVLYPFLSDYKRVWEMDLDVVAYEGLRYYFKWFDPMYQFSDEIFTKLGYIDVQHFASLIKCPVLFGTGLMDNICPPSTQFAVYNQLKCLKKHVIFPDFTHEEIGAFDDLLIDFFTQEDDAFAFA